MGFKNSWMIMGTFQRPTRSLPLITQLPQMMLLASQQAQ